MFSRAAASLVIAQRLLVRDGGVRYFMGAPAVFADRVGTLFGTTLPLRAASTDTLAKDAADRAKEKLKKGANRTRETFEEVKDTVKEYGQKAANFAEEHASEGANTAKSVGRRVSDTASDAYEATADKMADAKDSASSVVENIKEKAAVAGEGITDRVKAAWNSVTATTADALDHVAEKIRGEEESSREWQESSSKDTTSRATGVKDPTDFTGTTGDALMDSARRSRQALVEAMEELKKHGSPMQEYFKEQAARGHSLSEELRDYATNTGSERNSARLRELNENAREIMAQIRSKMETKDQKYQVTDSFKEAWKKIASKTADAFDEAANRIRG